MTTPTDPLFAAQWHLGMIGNIQRIWDEYRGSGVKVAVYDEGVEADHPDLAGNYDASLEFTFNGRSFSPGPLTSYSAHGTACAGIIGADGMNGRGGVGVAWDVTLSSVNYLDVIQTYYNPDRPTKMAVYTAGMLHAANFDVMSNSWGWAGEYQGVQNLVDPDSVASGDTALFAEICATGRGGLGTVVVQAAGNDYLNANGDGWHVSRHSLTVSATERDGFLADYSNWGSSILIAAPSAALTTDQTGQDGYNSNGTDGDNVPTNYTELFNGTSAAAPVVSGVVALMLEANPDLGWRDVHNILAMSAAHTGSAYGTGGEGFEVGEWTLRNGNSWNGGGNAFHLSYGYGLVDAFAAVRMAEAWLTFGAPAQTSANEQSVTVDYSGSSVIIPDYSLERDTAGVRELDLVVARNIEIETIYVTIDMSHSSFSDLNIYLIAPDGTEAHLAWSPAVEAGPFSWTFGVESFRGYGSAGTWSLRVEDWEAIDTGRIRDLKLEFFGSAASTDTVFHFTSDFLALAALDARRTSIDDLDGGTDWMNFAALEHDIRVKMRGGETITVDGSFWARFAENDIENLYAGDGNDRASGNGLDNHLVGGRGNDRLSGGSGNDTLEGGAGKDRLMGGAGNDVLTGGEDRDSFVFNGTFRADIITDFADNVDTLRLDDALWSGVRSVAQVLADFAGIDGAGNTTLTFGSNKITLLGLTDQDLLLNDLSIF